MDQLNAACRTLEEQSLDCTVSWCSFVWWFYSEIIEKRWGFIPFYRGYDMLYIVLHGTEKTTGVMGFMTGFPAILVSFGVWEFDV